MKVVWFTIYAKIIKDNNGLFPPSPSPVEDNRIPEGWILKNPRGIKNFNGIPVGGRKILENSRDGESFDWIPGEKRKKMSDILNRGLYLEKPDKTIKLINW